MNVVNYICGINDINTAVAQNIDINDVMHPCAVIGRRAKVVSCRCRNHIHRHDRTCCGLVYDSADHLDMWLSLSYLLHVTWYRLVISYVNGQKSATTLGEMKSAEVGDKLATSPFPFPAGKSRGSRCNVSLSMQCLGLHYEIC